MWDTRIRCKAVKELVIQHVCIAAVLMAASEKCSLQSCACKRVKNVFKKELM